MILGDNQARNAPTTVRFADRELYLLKRLARRERLTVSELIRRLIEGELEKESRRRSDP